MTPRVDLAGRIALVTGASRGIGRAIALALADCGADVAVNYRARSDDANAVAEAVRTRGRKACVVQADVSLGDDVSRLMAHVQDELGPIGILINNAGVALVRGVDELRISTARSPSI
jgi:3-oxoacyl-[acyl-carrier protein] reductase